MNILQIFILIFIILEIGNISILYFMPHSKIGNGTGVFKVFNNTPKDSDEYEFMTYMINWVAGSKLVFIIAGIIVIIFGDYQVQFFTVLALILSILSFYYRLFPMIKKMDDKELLEPGGYSKTLNLMIIAFISMFVLGIIISLIVM